MPLKDRRIAFVGAGNMGGALLSGILKADLVPSEQVTASTPEKEQLAALAQKHPGLVTTANNKEAVGSADIVVIAVKPQIIEKVLSEISGVVPRDALVLSVAAGVPIDFIHALVHRRVARAMPNTPAVVGMGATAVAFSEECDERDVEAVKAIFEAVGLVTVIDESLIDAVTGLSGSGPAFIFTIIEALADAGVKVGLPRRQAQSLAAQTVAGSARLLLESGEHPGVLKDQVTSPGGTAIAGLHTLEQGGLRTTLINAVQAATERARELGRQQAGHAASKDDD
ncbi:MAG: pyrroline-5-carboxylate reductase [Myxococcota bacterium]